MEKKRKKHGIIDHINKFMDEWFVSLEDKIKQYKNPRTKHIYIKLSNFIDKLNDLYYVRLTYQQKSDLWYEYSELEINY